MGAGVGVAAWQGRAASWLTCGGHTSPLTCLNPGHTSPGRTPPDLQVRHLSLCRRLRATVVMLHAPAPPPPCHMGSGRGAAEAVRKGAAGEIVQLVFSYIPQHLYLSCVGWVEEEKQHVHPNIPQHSYLNRPQHPYLCCVG